MGLRAYIVKRIVYSFILLMFVITLNFIIFFMMPGDPSEMWLNLTGRVSREELEKQKEALRQIWGLGEPRHIIFIRTTISLLTFNFGRSIMTGQPIASTLLSKMPYTLFLLGTSTIISIVIGVFLGVVAAYKRGGTLDSGLVTSSLILYSLPTFWMGMVFIFIFFNTLGWFPNAGTKPKLWASIGHPIPYTIQTSAPSTTTLGIQFNLNPSEVLRLVGGYLHHAFLPIMTLTLFSYGGYLLLTRATMLEALTEDYIVTARAKGVPERTVLLRHALKNASLPLITSAALSFGFILSGAIITETVYTYEGLGHWIWAAIDARDYPVVLPVFYIIAICVIVANFIADLLYGIIDPRIKYA
ncbi:MAG: ABC transporter permease [Candidatus Bathyarchaeia archaeon]